MRMPARPPSAATFTGNFSEHLDRGIYEGIWVGEDSPIPNTRGIRNDVVAALKKIKVPNLRWPGGCFADEYHWRDGIGPRAQRPTMINTHWGGVTEALSLNIFHQHSGRVKMANIAQTVNVLQAMILTDKEIYNAIRNELRSPAVELVHVSLELDQLGPFPYKDVIDIGEKLEIEKLHLPSSILRHSVINHFYLYDVHFQVKQSICSKLGISYQRLQRLNPANKLLNSTTQRSKESRK